MANRVILTPHSTSNQMTPDNKQSNKHLTPAQISSVLLWVVIFVLFLLIFMDHRGGSNGGSSPNVWIIWIPIVFTVIFISFLIIRIRRERAVLNLLLNGEIDRFIVEMDKRLLKTKNPKRRDIIKINKSAGFCDKGEWPQALALLDEVDFERLTPLSKLIVVNNRLFIMLLMGNLEEARHLREEHDSIFRLAVSNSKFRPAIDQTLAVYEIYFGDIREAEIKLTERLGREPGPLPQAFDYYFLGIIAMKRGKSQACKDFFEKAATLGKNTCIPALIQKQLVA
jgi:tetratricopeptide (TPR) repeat protein